MKLKSLLILAASALSFGANAQNTAQIGFGTANGIGPFNGTVYPLQKTQRIIHYTSSEMANAGLYPGAHINAVKWFKSNVAQYTIPNAARAILYMRNLDPALPNGYGVVSLDNDSLITTINYQPIDTVYYDNGTNAIDNNNWTGFSGFDFEYTGEDLEVYVDYQVIGSVGGLNDGIEWKVFTADVNVTHMLSSITLSNFGATSLRPNTQFGYSTNGAPVCPTVVILGSLSTVQGSVDAGDPVWVDMTGNYTNVPGLTTYRWQTAVNSQGPWVDISPLLSDPYFAFNAPNQTMVYRIILECGSAADTSNYIAIGVNPLPPTCPQIIVAGTASSNANGPLCPGANFELDITGNTYVAGSSTFIWESAPSASGPWSTYSNPLSFPIIGIGAPNTTTWYRAKVECGGNEAYTNEVEVVVITGPSGNFTINDALPTGGTNFHSFNDAVISLNCGISGPIVFDVAPGSGPYNEQVIIGAVATTATNTVTFNGNGATLSHTSDNNNELAVIKLNDADYITFRNLKILVEGTNAYDFGCGVQMMNDADNNTIDSCEVIVTEAQPSVGNSNYAGIALNGVPSVIEGGDNSYCDHNQILNNRVKNGYYGIVLWSAYDNPMSGNIIKGNSVEDFYTRGIMCLSTEGGLIESNNISRPERTTSGAFLGVNIVDCIGMQINANRIHDPAAAELTNEFNAAAINVLNCNPTNTNKNTISNNLVYNFISNGGSMGVQLENSKNVNIYHNTISLEHQNTSCIGCLGVYGIYQHNVQASKLYIKNNIITMNGTGGGEKHMLHFENPPMNSELDNNNYYFADGITNTAIGYMDGDDYETMEDWQQAVFGEQNSLMLNPMYEDAATGNFKPTKDSLDNKGEYVNIGNDINGATRSSTVPDMGAYEFEVVVTSVKNAKVAGNVSIYPNPATDVINIISPEKVDVQIMSVDGRIVSEQKNAVKVDVRNLAEGTYILKLMNNEGAVIKAEKLFKVSK